MDDRKPLSGKEYAALQSLFAAVSSFSQLIPILEARARMVPNLYRDLRLIQVKLETLLDKFLQTVPPRKLMHIKADISHVNLYVKVEPPGLRGKMPTGYSYTPTKALNSLLCYVCEHECLLCDKSPQEARKCPIRAMLDDSLPHDIPVRDGEHCKYSDFTLGLEEG